MIGGVVGRVLQSIAGRPRRRVAQLRAALEQAAAGRPAILVVTGEAGVGKTRPVPNCSALSAWRRSATPWPAGYARWRQAEPLLAQGAPQQAAGAALTRAWTHSPGVQWRGFWSPRWTRWAGGRGSSWCSPRQRRMVRRSRQHPPPDEFGLTPSGARGLGAGRRRPHQPPDRLEMVAISPGGQVLLPCNRVDAVIGDNLRPDWPSRTIASRTEQILDTLVLLSQDRERR